MSGPSAATAPGIGATQAWDLLLDEAERSPQAEWSQALAAAAALATVTVFDSGWRSFADPLPHGRTWPRQARRAAALLTTGRGAQEGPAVVLVRQVLAATEPAGPTPPRRSEQEHADRQARLQRCLALHDRLEERPGNEGLRAWCRYRAAETAYELRKPEQALDLAEQGEQLARTAGAQQAGILPAAGAQRDNLWLPERLAFHDVLAATCAFVRMRSLRDLGRYEDRLELALATRDRLRPARDLEPRLYLQMSVVVHGTAEVLASAPIWREVHEDLDGWEERSAVRVPRLGRQRLMLMANLATMVNDQPLRGQRHREALDVGLLEVSGAPPAGAPPAAYIPVADALLAAGQRLLANDLANSAYDYCSSFLNGGTLIRDDPRLPEVNGFLDVAQRIWEVYGDNGIYALQQYRARLALLQPDADRNRELELILEVHDQARYGTTRANVLLAAARLAPADHAGVKTRLDKAAGDANPRRRGRTLTARARWWVQSAEAATDPSRRRAAFLEAATDARAALEALEDGVFLDAPIAVESVQLLVAAEAEVHQDGDARDRLALLLTGVRAVVQDMVAVTTREVRLVRAQWHRPLVREALDLAITLADTDAVDVVLESVRRDRTGILLYDLLRADSVPLAIRRAAEEALAALGQAVTDRDLVAEPEAEDEDGDGGGKTRGTRALLRTQSRVGEAVDGALSGMAAVADLRQLDQVTGRELASAQRQLSPGRPLAVLQLASTDVPLLGSESVEVRLVRRLDVWLPGEPALSRHVDSVPLPLRITAFGTDLDWTRLAGAAKVLLPEPLLEALQQAATDAPLRLLVCLSGLPPLALEALQIGEDPGTLLLDRAAVTYHPWLGHALTSSHSATSSQTLTSAVASFEADKETTSADSPVDAMAVKDELEALTENFDVSEMLPSRDRFLQALRPGAAHHADVLALALHGRDDPDDGWNQNKRFPDGSLVTAGEALGITFPPVSVLASCNSPVRLRAGLDQAGWPMAALSRGSDTLVCGLWDIQDEATGLTMTAFWPLLRSRGDPVLALREAQLDMLARRPGFRHRPVLWAGLVVFGGAGRGL